MNITTDPNLWAICGLVFVLGLLIGIFLTAGGRRKWRERYNSEVTRRKEIEADRDRRVKDWDEREKELREREFSSRSGITKSRRRPDPRLSGSAATLT